MEAILIDALQWVMNWNFRNFNSEKLSALNGVSEWIEAFMENGGKQSDELKPIYEIQTGIWNWFILLVEEQEAA